MTTPDSVMNRILTLYILRQLVMAFAFATGAVTFVVLFTQSFRLLSLVIENSSTILTFLKLLGLSALTFLPFILPLGLGVAVIFVYNKLANDSELVVMRSAGVGPMRLIEPALILGAASIILCAILTLWLSPAAGRTLVATQYNVRDSYAVFLSRPGSFNDLSDGLTFYANRRGVNGALQGILIHDVRDPEQSITTMAQSGQIVDTNGQPRMIIFNGRRQEFDRTEHKLSELVFDQYVLDLDGLRDAPKRRIPDTRELTLAQLLDPSPEVLKVRGPMSRFRGELHSRLATPLLAFSYTFVALASILAGAFSRRGAAGRILVGALAIVVMQAAFMTINGVVARHNGLAFALYGIAIVPAFAAMAFLMRDFFPSRRLRRWMRRVLP